MTKNFLEKHWYNFFLKIVLPSLVAIILFISLLFFVIKPKFEEALLNKKREMIKELVNSASSILEKYHTDEIEGLISREEAQRTAISRIQYLRYGKDNKDYFWITDLSPVMIMHPYVPELNGKDLSNYTDPTGKKLFVESVELVKANKHGYIQYMWQFKDDSEHILPKISYVKLFEPWNWVIGTGVYIDDVKNEIDALTGRLINISLIITVFIFFILIFIAIQSYRIEKQRQKAEENLKISYEKYRSLVQASTEALVMIKDFKIIYANELFSKMVGNDNIYNLEIDNFIVIPKHIYYQLLQQNDNITPFETQIIGSVDCALDVLINISKANFYNQTVYIFTIKDVSIYNEAKKILLKTENKFKQILDYARIGYFKFTIDRRGRIIDANKETLKILNVDSLEKLKEKSIVDFIPEQSQRKSLWEEIFLNKRISNKLVKLKIADGQQKKAIISLKVYKDDYTKSLYAEGVIYKFVHTDEPSIIYSINDKNLLENIHTIFENNFEKVLIPVQKINYNTSINNLLKIISELDKKFLLVVDNENIPVGYISTNEIISILAYADKLENLKAYQIMKSPVVQINRDASLMKSLNLAQTFNTEFLIVTKSNQPVGVFNVNSISEIFENKLLKILLMLNNCSGIEQIKKLKKDYEDLLCTLILQQQNSILPLFLFSELHDVVINSIFRICFDEMGKAPCDFVFMVMGSEARNEQSFSTDQDNAIIFEKDDEECEKYFIDMGVKISYYLNEVGFNFCKGNNMASNPKWVKPLNIWKNYFASWIHKGSGQDLLDINIFFDLRAVYGNFKFVDSLYDHIFNETLENKAYLSLLARNSVSYKLSLTKTINIKEIISALVNITRIYAISNNLTTKSTSKRLFELHKLGVINSATYEDLIKVHEFLFSIRLKHQAMQIKQNKIPDNNIELEKLSEFEISCLKHSISVINSMQNKLIHDFKVM